MIGHLLTELHTMLQALRLIDRNLYCYLVFKIWHLYQLLYLEYDRISTKNIAHSICLK